ncbi:hypothetical protein ACWGSK_00470 [Nocardiopsis sp. NPDC055551]|uniref:hypothetical protein n=1 Tax=Nocardiopsis sp. NPDC006832 TaxID=3157188 RepID=UPI0033DCC919
MKSTNTVRWDKDRQRWERAPEREVPAIGRHGTPAGVIVGLAAAALFTGLAPAVAGVMDPGGSEAGGGVADGGSSTTLRSLAGDTEGDLASSPAPWATEPQGPPERDGVGTRGPDSTGAGSGEEGSATESEETGSGGTDGTGSIDNDPDEDASSASSPVEEEPSEDEVPRAEDGGERIVADPADFTLGLPESWERRSEGPTEAVFYDTADEAFHLSVLWESDTEATPLEVLEERVAQESRQAEGYEEILAVTEDAWHPDEVAFEYLTTGDEGTERALAIAFQQEEGPIYVMVSVGPEEARDSLQDTLDLARSTFTPGSGEPRQE